MKMTSEVFAELLEELDGCSRETLVTKNRTYSEQHDGDCLHNFRAGAEIMGGTPAQAAWGYMTKHLVALRDMVDRDDFSDLDNLKEKCQDINNYIRFIWCIGNERHKMMKENELCCGDEAASEKRVIDKFDPKLITFKDYASAYVLRDALHAICLQDGYFTAQTYCDLAGVVCQQPHLDNMVWHTTNGLAIRFLGGHGHYVHLPDCN